MNNLHSVVVVSLCPTFFSIPGTCHVSRAFGLEARAAQTRPLVEQGSNCQANFYHYAHL